MGFCIYIFRDVIISVLFTEAFRSARELFLIQLIGDVIKIASWLFAYPMLSTGAVKIFVISEIVFSFLFIVLSYICIVLIGLKGAPISYSITYLIYFIFVYFNMNNLLRQTNA